MVIVYCLNIGSLLVIVKNNKNVIYLFYPYDKGKSKTFFSSDV